VGDFGPSTRAVQAGLPEPAQGEPFLPGPVFAAPFHLQGPADATRFSYQRYTNPTWENLEAAVGELEGGEALFFASGMAAVSAVVVSALRPGDVLVAPSDSYPGIRAIALEHLQPRGIEVRLVPTEESAVLEALHGATMVWVESPANPGLETLDLVLLANEAHAAGATFVVDNTLAGPLRQRPLELGADVSVSSASKSLTGHSDLVLGYVAATDPERLAALRAWRGTTGAIPGSFEAWLAHRSLATLAVRLERQEANAAALAEVLRLRDDVEDVRWPRVGSVLCFTLTDADRAQAFLDAMELVAEATSFGGLHSTAERRARWGTDAVAEGWIRFSAGIEDTEDLVADVAGALDATR
jgi:cystathionine gamma-lyase